MKKEMISEALGEISDKHVKEAVEYKKKGSAWTIAIAVSAAVLVLVMGVTAFIGGKNEPPRGVSHTDHASDIFINTDDLAIAMADMDIQIEWYDINNISDNVRESFEERVGISLDEFTARFPEEFEADSMWSYFSRYDETGVRHEEYLPYDYRFSVVTPDGGSIRLSVCGNDEPLRDCIVVCENARPSTVGNVEMYIYGAGDVYYTLFESGGIFFDIEAENISSDTLVQFIENII